MLAPLGYYGGPTQTMPLVSGSPAIGAAEFYQNGYPNPPSISYDQRGQPIQSGGNIDIGAFQDVPILITIAGDGPNQEGDLSVQDATNTAAAEGGNPTIGFAPSSFNAGDNAPADEEFPLPDTDTGSYLDTSAGPDSVYYYCVLAMGDSGGNYNSPPTVVQAVNTPGVSIDVAGPLDPAGNPETSLDTSTLTVSTGTIAPPSSDDQNLVPVTVFVPLGADAYGTATLTWSASVRLYDSGMQQIGGAPYFNGSQEVYSYQWDVSPEIQRGQESLMRQSKIPVPFDFVGHSVAGIFCVGYFVPQILGSGIGRNE